MMQVDLYDRDEHYGTLCEWWRAHGWEPVLPEALPPLGAIMYDETDGVRTNICAGFLYMAVGCGFSMMEWVVSNPNAGAMRTARGITELVKFLRSQAAANDYGIMMTSTNNDGLLRLYHRAGFSDQDKNLTHLLMFTKT